MSGSNWTRACPGLYVDPTNTWLVSREGRGWYSIRACLGWGPLLDGTTMFPDMGSIWHGDYRTLAEAKHAVEQMTKNGETPALDLQEQVNLEYNLTKTGATR